MIPFDKLPTELIRWRSNLVAAKFAVTVSDSRLKKNVDDKKPRKKKTAAEAAK